MESDEIEDLERQIQMLEQKKRDLKKKKLIKRVKDLENEVQEMELSGESDKDSLTNDMKLRKDRTDLTGQDTDTSRQSTRQTKKTSSEEQIKRLRVMFESVEEMLESPDYDEDLQKELSAACPNYMTYFLTAKRDLLRNDCGIVVTGETSAGKTTQQIN